MSADLRLMTRAGKTFYFATLWLDARARQDAALAYNFCRAVDDIADATPPRVDRDSALIAIAQGVRTGDSAVGLVRPILPLLERFPTVRDPFASLVDACREDQETLHIEDEYDLERYAHGVAGNVGLIMYPILGGESEAGCSPAADVGIAMQCTNIARDVLEDLSRNRVYLPRAWLRGEDVRTLLDNGKEGEAVVVAAVERLLSFAHGRYRRGLAGIDYLAPRYRFAIKVAARCYAAIGDRVIQQGRLSRVRAVVPFYQKVILACGVGISRRQEPCSVQAVG